MTWRDTKRAARRVVHDTMQIDALYLVLKTPADVEDPYEQTPITVRIHTSLGEIGDLKGTNFHYAERHDVTPTIVFLREQITPSRNGIVSVATGEAYRIDHMLDPDDEFVKGEAIRMSAADAAGLPVPEDA